MAIKIRKCRKCNEYLENETDVCPKCNADLIESGINIVLTDKCPKCNAKISSSGTHCRKCGARYHTGKKPFWTMP